MFLHALRNVACQALYRLVHTGIPWRDLPPRFGHWNSVFRPLVPSRSLGT